ncbi:MAG: hypothetical protein WDW36_009843 [Sanguina aurantia]
MNPTDEGGTMASALSLLSGARLNSLDGPFPRQVTDPTKRKLGFGFGADGTVEDAVQLRPAATAAQCAVCHAALRADTCARGESSFTPIFPEPELLAPHPPRPTRRSLRPVSFPGASTTGSWMRCWTSRPSRGWWPLVRRGAALAFYVIKDRKGDSEPTPPEKHAIKLACQMLIKDDAELADVLVKHLALFASQWQALVEGGPAAEAMARLTQTHPLEKQGDAVSEAAAAGGAPPCEDKHPLCAKWAAKGECTANPSYMVGGGHHAGQCRKSCRACSARQTLAEAIQEDKILVRGGGAGGGGGTSGCWIQEGSGLVIGFAGQRADGGRSAHVRRSNRTGPFLVPASLLVPQLSAAAALGPKLGQLVAGLQLAVRNLGCGASRACLSGVNGAAWPLASESAASGEGFSQDGEDGSAFLSPMNVGGGFVLGKPFFGIPSLKQLPLSSLPPHLHPPAPVSATTAPATAPAAHTHSRGQAPATGRPSAAATAPSAAATAATAAGGDGAGVTAGGGSGGGGGGAGSEGVGERVDPPSIPPTHAEVDAVLAGALAGRLVRLPTEYFTFEYLYKNHTRHYHEDPKTRQVTEEWSLGGFSRESVSIISSVTGQAAVLEELDLPPDRRAEMRASGWPYVKQVYAGGQECVLAGGRKAVRRSEVRLACSPDSKLRILIREPDFCHYVFIIYVPQLCDMPFYAARASQT